MSPFIAGQDYPLFIPPGDLATRDRRVWTRKEADAYFDWPMSVKQERIDALLELLEESWPCADVEHYLLRMGANAAAFLKMDAFSSNRCLTNRGYALAADMGLLVADRLVAANPAIRWMVLRGPKSDMSYNLPVLVGFGPLNLDPVGGSIAEAVAMLRGDRPSTSWREIYCFWSQKAAESGTGDKDERPSVLRSGR